MPVVKTFTLKSSFLSYTSVPSGASKSSELKKVVPRYIDKDVKGKMRCLRVKVCFALFV